MKERILCMVMSLFCLQLLPAVLFGSNDGVVAVAGDWKQEFGDVCGQTQNAMELSPEQLQSYIDRCDKLQDRMHELGDTNGPERKIYAKRLRMCRDVYQFVLAFKDKKE